MVSLFFSWIGQDTTERKVMNLSFRDSSNTTFGYSDFELFVVMIAHDSAGETSVVV
jgi:hypothetical protein